MNAYLAHAAAAALAGGGGSEAGSLKGIIDAAGLSAGLVVCLDAGSALSYPGSGQTWSDLSGSGNDFVLGATSAGSEASDPTFSGTPGGLSSSEYFPLDGGDWATLAAGANPAAIEAIHKDGALWAYLALIYGPSSWGANDAIIGTGGDLAAGNGVGFAALGGTGAGKIGLRVANGSGQVIGAYPDVALGTSQWLIVGGGIDEATGAAGGFFYLNGAYRQVSSTDTFNATYSSPSAGSAAQKLQFGAAGNGALPMASGSRLAALAIWSGVARTKAHLDAVYGASPATGLRARVGL